MQSDNLIRKLLKAAAVVEAVYLGISLICCLCSEAIVNNSILFGDSGITSSDNSSLIIPYPDLIHSIVISASFFLVWSFLNKATDPYSHSNANGFMMIGLVVFNSIMSILGRLIVFPSYLAQLRADNYIRYSLFSNYVLRFMALIYSAATTLLWISFGMEWYRDKLIKEQAMLAAQAANIDGGLQNAPADTEDSAWDSFRSTLISEQAEEVSPQEFIFNDKQ